MSTSLALVTAASRIAGRVAGDLVLSWTARWRAAITASRRAKKSGLPVKVLQIRRWLNFQSTKTAIETYDAKLLAEAASELNEMLPDRLRSRKAGEILLQIVLDEILKSLPTGRAISELDHRQDARLQQGIGSTHARLDAIQEVILAGGQLEESLAKLPPIDKQWTVELAAQWPKMNQIAHQIASDPSPPALLRQWSETHPSWVSDAPPSVLAWLSVLTSMYGEDKAAVAFLDLALAEGVGSRGYWISRRAFTIAKYDEAGAKNALSDANVSHPLAEALALSLDEDLEGARVKIDTWNPEESTGEILKVLVLSRIYRATGSFENSMKITEDAIGSHPAVSSLKLENAHAHLQRAAGVLVVTRFYDAQIALQRALEARDATRVWGGETSEAVVVACRSAMVLENYERAWSLTQLAPDGEATLHESKDASVLVQAAIIAAGTGRATLARELSAKVDEFTAGQIEAMMATANGDADLAREYWRQVWPLCGEEPNRIFRVAQGLAQLGAEVPDPQRLTGFLSAETIRELNSLRNAMMDRSDRLSWLRSHALDSPIVALELAKEYDRTDQFVDSAQVLFDAAEKFHDANMMLMASRNYAAGGVPADARRAAESALSIAPRGWPGARSAYESIVQIHMNGGEGDLATQAAVRFLHSEPESDAAKWLLLKVHLSRGDTSAAWQIFRMSPRLPEPNDTTEALIWIQLNARFATTDTFFSRARALLSQWQDDQQFCESALSALYSGDWLKYEPSAETATQLKAAASGYFERFGSEGGFREYQFESPEKFLSQIADELRYAHDSLAEVDAMVRNRRVPVGAYASLHRRTYTEASVRRAAGEVYSIDGSRRAIDLENARGSIEADVIIDITSLHTLALFDETLAALLQGSFRRVMVTDQFFGDLSEAASSLARQSGISAVWDPTESKAAMSVVDDDSMLRLRQLSARMLQLASLMPRVSRPEVTHVPLKQSKDGQRFDRWLSGLDLAIEKGQAYWCDDALLRQLAEEFGAQAFDTFSLIRVLRETSTVSAGDSNSIQAIAIHNFYSEFEFDELIFGLATQLDGLQPGGAARALMWPLAWRDPERVIAFVLHRLREVSQESPDSIVGWVTAVAIGLTRIGAEPAGSYSNLLIWLNRIVAQDWCDGSRLPFVLQGIRGGMNGFDVEDPIPAMIEGLYGSLVARFDQGLAARYLLALFSSCNERDRAAAARTVLLQR